MTKTQLRFARICREAPPMRRMGDSVTLIAARLRVSVHTVYRALRRTGNGRWRWGGS